MGLFTDIYNTVAKFFRPQDEHVGEDPSKTVATNRLKLVLMQDRTNLTPKVLEQMRGEMIELLSKYLEMDKDLLELNFEQEGDQVALMLSIPVIRAKDEDEIEAAISTSNNKSEDSNSESEEVSSEVSTEEDFSEEITSEEQEIPTEEAPKPKKRRSKKVTPPEELEQTCANDECHCENENCECHQETHSEEYSQEECHCEN